MNFGKFNTQSHIIDKENGFEFWQANFRVFLDVPLTAEEWETAMMALQDKVHLLIHQRDDKAKAIIDRVCDQGD